VALPILLTNEDKTLKDNLTAVTNLCISFILCLVQWFWMHDELKIMGYLEHRRENSFDLR